MRTNLTYIVLGIIGFILAIIFQDTFSELSSLPKLIVTITGVISIPILEYIINSKYHAKEKLKRMSKSELDNALNSEPHKTIEYFESKNPSPPQSFGYKINWLVVKSNDINKVLSNFPNSKKVKTNWRNGVNASFENRQLKFISPPLNNWIFVLNYSNAYVNNDKVNRALVKLSEEYGQAYYFGSFRGTGFALWSKHSKGEEIRSFMVDDGDVLYSFGELEKEEIELLSHRKANLNKENQEEIDYYKRFNYLNLLGSEDDVLMMAEKWTINPMELHKYESNDLGYLIE